MSQGLYSPSGSRWIADAALSCSKPQLNIAELGT